MLSADASSSSKGKDPRKQRQLKFLVLGAAGAGKTSLLRRFFYKKYDSERAPTVGADFYVGRVPNPANDSSSSNSNSAPSQETKSGDNYIPVASTVNIQMWDTPGKENFLHHRNQRQVPYSATLSDSFFQHADAIMLVYDMTSSTSFTRLLKWYADLLQLFQTTLKPVPILIVANKLDLFQQPPDNHGGTGHLPPRTTQRNVMGLTGHYTGKDFQYEYHICSSETLMDERSTASLSTDFIGNSAAEKVGGGGDSTKHGKVKRRMEISSYLVNRDNWTTDGSYLDSIIHSEDKSHPDREMVLLWCMRNGLKMVEMSAATGEGVNEAVVVLVGLATEQSNRLDSSATEAPLLAMPEKTKAAGSMMTQRPNEELDLLKRYTKDGENCFFFLPSLRQCLRRF